LDRDRHCPSTTALAEQIAAVPFQYCPLANSTRHTQTCKQFSNSQHSATLSLGNFTKIHSKPLEKSCQQTNSKWAHSCWV